MILGGVGLAIAQRGTDTQVETNRRAIEDQSAAARRVPVIENEISNINDKLATIKRENDIAHDKIENRLEQNKQEILEAIQAKH
jgi:hypothetical protein